MRFVNAFLVPFLSSMYPFYDNLWFNFSELLQKQPFQSQSVFFSVLDGAVRTSMPLMEPLYREVIRGYCLKEPLMKRPPVILNIILYKSAKLYFPYRAMLAHLSGSCEPILRNFRLMKRGNPPPGAQGLIALFLTDSPTVSTTPTLIDGRHIVCLPTLVSKFDLY
jgi:hypothetical protein